MEEIYSRIGGSLAKEDDRIYNEFLYKSIMEKASTDGQFAIAFAILELSKTSEKLRNELCFESSASGEPGVLKKMSMEIRTLAEIIRKSNSVT